jgi:hypothetical protein
MPLMIVPRDESGTDIIRPSSDRKGQALEW